MFPYKKWANDYHTVKSPDNTDCSEKFIKPVKKGLYAGVSLAIIDAFALKQCKSFPHMFNTFAFWTVPITGMVLAHSSVSYIAGNLRKKDDSVNGIYGALAASYIAHKWLKNMKATGFIAFVLLYCNMTRNLQTDTNIQFLKLLDTERPPFQKWYHPWLNDTTKNFYPASRYEFDRTSYYKNF